MTEHDKPQASSESGGDPRTATTSPSSGKAGRSLVMVNVIVATLLVIGIAGAANYIAWWMNKKYDLKVDLTAGQRYSFSERTRKTLDEIEGPVRLTALFVADEKDEEAKRRKSTMEEELRRYESAAGNVTVQLIDPTEDAKALLALGQRIAEAHADEVKPYVATIKSLLEFEKKLIKTLQGERAAFDEGAKRTDIPQDLRTLFTQLSGAVKREEDTHVSQVDSIEEEFAGPLELPVKEAATLQGNGLGIPEYTATIGRLALAFQQTANLLDKIRAAGEQIVRTEGLKLPDDVQKVLGGAGNRYHALEQELGELLKPVADLAPLDMDATLKELQLNTVVIEAGGKVRVATFDQLWPVASGQDRYNPEAKRVFAGEDVITSNLLTLASKDRPAAIFVTWGGQGITDAYGNYTEIAKRLSRSNFALETWDLSRQPDMPQPKNTSRAVLVCMVPEQQQSQNPMMPPPPPAMPEAYKPVRDFLAGGGSVMLLARPGRPGEGALPYGDLFADLGLKLDREAVVIESHELPDGQKQLSGDFIRSSYPEDSDVTSAHAIVQPLQGLQSRFSMVAPMTQSASLPAGLQVMPLVVLSQSSHIWAETDLMRLFTKGEAEFDPNKDQPSPLLMVAAVTKDVTPSTVAPAAEGQPFAAPQETRTARAVVCAGDVFLMDNVPGQDQSPLAAPSYAVTPSGVVSLYVNPGNAELFVNSMLWLAGREDMIAVSPAAHEPGRIRFVTEGWRETIRWSIWAGLPAMVILIGLVVYLVRTRVR